jgi:GTP-dependent dephospho-CoA kinase
VRSRLSGILEPVRVRNPPGTITDELEESVLEALKRQAGDILVEGEDDLAALVVLAYAPRGSVVVYGMPSKGAVIVNVTEEDRENARELLGRMEKA